MMPWFVRYSIRMGGILAVMLLVELAAFFLERDFGLNRLVWYPVSYGLVALAGYDTVKRLPLVWGALIGAVLAGTASLLSWPTGARVLDGSFAFPPEAEPLLVATALLMAAIIGAIIGVVAGMVARSRRRKRSRRSALAKLAYGAYDEPVDDVPSAPHPMPMPMAERAERR